MDLAEHQIIEKYGKNTVLEILFFHMNMNLVVFHVDIMQ